ncbi:transcriptional regulator family: Fungal Specific TF [Aspergillus niger]|nr:transcriptional regulator family: Fungal Specific TF [Aspergillus niger]
MSAPDARHLKACRPCSKAKVRCDPGPTDACQRCHRLGKECTRQPSKPHTVKRHNVSSDVGRLEKKLDDVTSLLTASQRYIESIGGSNPSPLSATDSGLVIPPVLDEDVEKMLADFNERITRFLPFVIRSPRIGLDDLRTIKPFLNLVIPAVVCQGGSAQAAHSIRARDYWMEHMLANGEHSLDLLQGFLAYLGWTQTMVPAPRSTMINNYLHILEAQVINLDFHRENKMCTPGTVFSYLRVFNYDERMRSSRTLEELRAYLGCYYMVNMLSLCLGEKEPMEYMTSTDDCCRRIQEAAECETDPYLLQLVRIAHLGEKIYRAVQYHEKDIPTGLAPKTMAIRWLQKELQQLKDSYSGDFIQSLILNLHYHTLEILLYRIALERDFGDATFNNYPLTQIDVLCACLNATRSLFDTLLSIPPILYLQLPYTCWTQIGHGLAILSRLLVHNDPTGCWDREWARQTISFEDTVDTFSMKVDEAVAQALAEHMHVPPIFNHIKARTIMWKEAHQARCATMDRWRWNQEQAQMAASSGGGVGVNVDGVGSDVSMEDLLAMGPIWNLFSL